MRTATATAEDIADQIAGTTIGDHLIATVWRGGYLMADNLEIVSYTFDWDATRAVQGQATFVIADPDGTLAPWALSDALGPGGSRIHVEYEFGITGTRVPLGVWRIREADPQENWRTYRQGKQHLRFAGGGQITIQADEETCSLALDRLDPGARVPKYRKPLAEVAYLARDYLATTLQGITDNKTIPPSLVYEDDRLGAIEDLLHIAGATHRMSSTGNLEIIPATGIDTGYVLDGGEEGTLITLTRSLSDQGLYNAAISTGQNEDQTPIIGRATLEAGPLKYGGPFGKVPIFHQSIASTQATVTQDAATLLAGRQAAGEVELSIECLAHPGLQLHDLVTVIAPTIDGDAPLMGRISRMVLTTAVTDQGSVPAKRMQLNVMVDRDVMERIKAKARGEL